MNRNSNPIWLRAILVLFICCLSVSDSIAQYTDGYIVFVKGDTLRGQIDNQDWEVSPDHIYFKENSASEPTRIEAEQLETFLIKSTNRRFVSRKIGIIEVYKNNVFAERASLIPKKMDFVFLETILLGPQASLYKLINKSFEPHFYIETPAQFIELGSYSYYRDIEGKQYVETIENYKEKLINTCSSAPNFTERLPSYTEEGIKKYLMRYNACFQEETLIYRSKKQNNTYNIMAGLGAYIIPKDGNSAMVYTVGGRLNMPGRSFKRFLRGSAMLIPSQDEFGKKSLTTWTSISLGSYIGNAKFQPYFALGLIDLVFNNGLDGGAPLFLSTGISYKKMVEFEISNWGNLLTFLYGEDAFFPPCFSVRFYPNFFKSR